MPALHVDEAGVDPIPSTSGRSSPYDSMLKAVRIPENMPAWPERNKVLVATSGR